MSNILEQLEKYVDKIVFTVVGMICLALLWFFVISNPYAEEYGGQKLGPGQFDKRVRADAKRLEDKMLEAPVTLAVRKSQVGQFVQKLASSIEIANDYAMIPGVGEIATLDDRSYKRPEIPSIEDVAAEWYRTVAHVPTDIVDPLNTYKTVGTEYEDIDIVSVQGTFNVQKLIGNFVESFNPSIGSMLAKYRSSELAKPLFASIELQRQQLADDGWMQWETIPHTKVNPYGEILENIPADIAELEIGGIDLLMVNYTTPAIQRMILQPDCYEFASNMEQWFPPKFHVEYVKLMKMERDKEREDARRSEKGRPVRISRRDTMRDDMMGDEMMMQRDQRGRIRRDSAKKGPRTLRDVEMDYNKWLLRETMQLGTYKDGLHIWAHDDTVLAGSTYRYRMRLGVFNPTAGRGWFDGKDKEYANSVVLWSQYTDITKSIEIDPMIYFFPVGMSKNEESVSIQVSKYAMGNWKSHQFDVLPGQTIGYEIEDEKKKNTFNDEMDMGMMEDEYGQGYATQTEPTVIDYTTNVTLVDVISVLDLPGPSFRPKRYFDILYSIDGTYIKRLPIKKNNWPKHMQASFEKIRSVHDLEVELTTRGTVSRNKYQDRSPTMMMEEGIFDY